MKYGLLYEANTGNIGDDIQSYASLQFLPHIDYFIDRESLDQFTSENNERVIAIFNAWFLNNKLNWPPANSIVPLCIAMHFAKDDPSGYELGYSFLEGIGASYLKNYGPVGCRDTGTMMLLKERGIEAYFSGCLTLTLPKQKKNVNTKPYVCLVDVPDRVCEAVKLQLEGDEIEVLRISHHVEVLSQWYQREERVVELLKKYQNAQCVITTRLHCALPCVAMEVPVLFLEDNQEYRTADYLKFLTHTTVDAFCKGNFYFSVKEPTRNSEEYVTIRNSLIHKVKDFINKVENGLNVYPNFFVASVDDRYKWKINVLSKQLLEANIEKNHKAKEVEQFLENYCDEKKRIISIKKLARYYIWKIIHKE